jgi:uncharacterized protein (TIGR02271 family)
MRNDTPPDPVRDVEQPAVVPVIKEEVVPGRRKVRTGAVRVHKRVERRTEHVEMPLMRETVDVRRVAVNRPVDHVPQIRHEGDITIVPVVEEEVVVTKRLMLKEEIHLVRRRTQITGSQDVPVAMEHAEVERVDAEGRLVDDRAGKPLFGETEGILFRRDKGRS